MLTAAALTAILVAITVYSILVLCLASKLVVLVVVLTGVAMSAANGWGAENKAAVSAGAIHVHGELVDPCDWDVVTDGSAGRGELLIDEGIYFPS